MTAEKIVLSLLLGLLALAVPFLAQARAAGPESLELGEDVALEIHAPAGAGPHPAVLLLHGCSGLEHSVLEGLRDHAAALLAEGYLAVIVDSFSRRDNKGGGRVCESLGSSISRATTAPRTPLP